MKIDCYSRNLVEIQELYPGDTFRTERFDEIYVKVNRTPRFCKEESYEYAVNLVNGLLRKFETSKKVEKIDAKITY